MDDIVTFEDDIARLRDDFTHYTGMAISAYEAGNVEDGAQWLDAAHQTFERLATFAVNIYNETMDRALCFNPNAVVVSFDSDVLILNDQHPFSEQFKAAV